MQEVKTFYSNSSNGFSDLKAFLESLIEEKYRIIQVIPQTDGYNKIYAA